jgi:hypothetical protein
MRLFTQGTASWAPVCTAAVAALSYTSPQCSSPPGYESARLLRPDLCIDALPPPPFGGISTTERAAGSAPGAHSCAVCPAGKRGGGGGSPACALANSAMTTHNPRRLRSIPIL